MLQKMGFLAASLYILQREGVQRVEGVDRRLCVLGACLLAAEAGVVSSRSKTRRARRRAAEERKEREERRSSIVAGRLGRESAGKVEAARKQRSALTVAGRRRSGDVERVH